MSHQEIRSLMCDILDGSSTAEIEEINHKIRDAYNCGIISKDKYELLLRANTWVCRLANKGWW